MDEQDRDFDSALYIYPDKSKKGVSLDVIKSKFIAEGKTADEIAGETGLSVSKIKTIIEDSSLVELRKAYIVEGIQKIQSVQLHQAHKLMDLENKFKKMRIIQLEQVLEDNLAYYGRHGDFCKRHPTTGDIMKNTDGIPMQIMIPNVSRELTQLKESTSISENLRSLLHRLDEIINQGQPEEGAEDPDSFDLAGVSDLFRASNK